MDPEQTFLRVHARVSGMLSQLLTPRIRTALEYVYLFIAVILFSVLVVMHNNFVQQPGCSSQLSATEITEAQLVRIKICSAGLWSNVAADESVLNYKEQGSKLAKDLKVLDNNGDGFAISAVKSFSTWIIPGTKRNKLNYKSWMSDKDILEHQMESISNKDPKEKEIHDYPNDLTAKAEYVDFHDRESFKTAILHIFNKSYLRFVSFWRAIMQINANISQSWDTIGIDKHTNIPKYLPSRQLDNIYTCVVQWLEKGSRVHDPTFLYTNEKGYFLLPEDAKSQHSIHTVNVTISANDLCFGNRWQRILINKFVGYDTILTNSLLSSLGPGYLYNFQTKEFYDLSYGSGQSDATTRFGDYFVSKCSVLLMSLFVFFTTTMSVSFTLRETQSRMLKFTVQLQHHARHHLPTFQLIFVHVLESLVFVPIMIGILFFLFEFYDDQLLAFLVLTLVWLCELFTMISVRTPLSMQFFPRFFLLYFLVFHIYFFSYGYGFSYLAFSTTAAFMQHLILFFWNRYEVPALQRFMRNRVHFEQQTGVHITSSTILTSTLHIARLNMRNPNIMPNEPSEGEFRSEPDEREHVDNSGYQQPSQGHSNLGEATQIAESDSQESQQAETTDNSDSLNPFGSLLLWILGGVSTDGIVSFFSLFRDLRDQQNRVYVERNEDGSQPIT